MENIMKNKILRTLIFVILMATTVFTSRIDVVKASHPNQGPDRRPHMASSRDVNPYAITSPVTAQDLAVAMGINPSEIVSASLNGSDPAGVGIGTSPLGGFFPREGSTFAILSTGLAQSADTPNDSNSLSHVLDGLNNASGYDMTQLALTLKVPSNINCANFDFIFYSEEFPEFVGSIYNDTFTAEIPQNIALDSNGNIISINTVYGVTSVTGTTYDGGTTLLRAHAPVTPGGTLNIVFTIQDLGDSIYDSTVFLDEFIWSNTTQCTEGANNFTTFYDVPTNYWAWKWIDDLYGSGITGGCISNPLQYCPESPVTRAQMAVFLLRGIHGPSYTPPAVGGSTGFADVPTSYWAAAWIKQLAVEGITGGCGGGNFCPDTSVTRAQMAVFLLKSKHGVAYNPPAATGVFTDVPVGYWADKWIEQLSAEGITGGCGPGIYCPDNPVTRAQMAVFLVKTFNLP
ncbi:MAG: S-layer homology domain-containing protein [Anaerolineae bacterium]|nr:S-layer homology domain-containing protein [Anaerolineae bacterium]